jgi:hypothetical protein
VEKFVDTHCLVWKMCGHPLYIRQNCSPLWSPDGRELFYRSGDATMAVEVETEPTFKRGNPKILFQGKYFSSAFQKAVMKLPAASGRGIFGIHAIRRKRRGIYPE